MRKQDVFQITFLTAVFTSTLVFMEPAFAESDIGRKIHEAAEEASGIVMTDARPFVTALIGVASGVAVGIYKQNIWAAGVAALMGGAFANIFPDLW